MKKSYDLEKNIIEQAKTAVVKIDGAEERKRAFALSIGAFSLAKILKSENINVSTKLSLFKIPSFAQNFELADIYAGDVKIDVRVIFEGDKFYIPKSHKKYEAEPDIYAVVRLNSQLSNIEMIGFAASSDLNSSVSNDEYYVYETSVLQPFKNLKKALKEVIPSQYAFSKSEHEKINELCVEFFDSQISESEKIFFIKHLVNCNECREKISEFNEFEIIINQAKNYPDLLDDSTLDILSGCLPLQKDDKNDSILESGISSSMFEIVKDITETAADTAILAAEAGVAGLAAEAVMNEVVADTAESMLDLAVEEGSLDELFAAGDEKAQEDDVVEEQEIVEEVEEDISEEQAPVEMLEEAADVPESVVDEEILQETDFDDISELSELSEESVLTDIAELSEPIEELAESITEEAVESVEEVTPPAEEEISAVEETTDIEEFSENLDFESSDGLELGDLDTLDGREEELILEEHEVKESTEQSPSIVEPHMDELEEVNNYELQVEPQEIETLQEECDEEIQELGQEEITEEPAEDMHREIQEEIREEARDEIQDVITDESNDMMLQADDLDNLDEITESVPVEEIQTVDEEPDTPAYSGIELIDEDETPTEYNAPVQEEPAYEGIEMIDEEEPVEQPAASVEVSADTPEINPEIQNLLDDELLQLLSSDDSDTPEMPTEDAVAGMDDESFIVEESDSEIEALYENNPEVQEGEEGEAVLDLSKEPISAKTASMTKKIVMAAILLLVLGAGGLTAFYLKFNKTNDSTPMLPDLNDQTQTGSPLEGATNAPQNGAPPEPAMSQDLNKSMTNVFSEQPAAVTITKISWEVSQKLAADPTFKNYLQVAGKNLQMNLQNDLSYTTDFNYNNKVKVSMEIAKDNTIKRIQATESSGSEQIDNVVLQSIKETLKYINVPDIKDYNGNYNLSVVINF